MGNVYLGEALCDLGAANNIMPYITFKKIGGLKLRVCFMDVCLADRTLIGPIGMVRDIKINKDCMLILGRSFIETAMSIMDL